MAEFQCTATLTVRAPFHLRATEPQDPTIDAPLFVRQRRSSGGGVHPHAVLPGTSIKGRFSHALRELQDDPELVQRIAPLQRLVGGEGNSPSSRGDLWFEDFESVEPVDIKRRTRIQIDPDRRAVAAQALVDLEQVGLPGDEIEFRGSLHLRSADRESATRELRCIRATAPLIPAFGGFRQIGFGVLTGVEFGELEEIGASISATTPLVESPDTALGRNIGVRVLLRPRGPVCLTDRPGDRGNLFEGSEVWTGAALKGTFARCWSAMLGTNRSGEIGPGCDPARTELAEVFSKTRWLHALPCRPDPDDATRAPHQRPRAIPLTWARVAMAKEREESKVKEVYADLAWCPGPILVECNDQLEAPAFRVDWKYEATEAQSTLFGWPHVRRELRTRTAHDLRSRRAKTGSLFTYECVVPQGREDKAEKCASAWVSEIHLPADTSPKALDQLESLLRAGLRGFGKTKATVDIEIVARSQRSEPGGPDPAAESPVIVLESDALLIDSRTMDECSGIDELKEAYSAAISELSNGSLELRWHRTHEILRGGEFQRQRFSFHADSYHPEIMTQSESVFVLRTVPGKESEAAGCLDEWETRGLPIPASLVRRLISDASEGARDSACLWKRTPYIRENGYGEVRVRDLEDIRREAIQVLGKFEWAEVDLLDSETRES